jgi:glycosyltransferase involved in cell wall biosynthesis
LKVKRFKKVIYLKLFKFFELNRKIHWHATDKQEQIDIQTVLGNESMILLAHLAVDTPTTLAVKSIDHRSKTPGTLRLIFLSLITEKKNLLFLLSALKKIPKNLVISLDVFGPIKDQDYWDQCLKMAANLPKHIRFIYRGSADPVNVVRIVQGYDFLVLPTLGENFGHAIYESFVAGRPVIISNKTPWTGLQEKMAGWDLPLNEEAFVLAIVKAVEMDAYTYLLYCQGAKNEAQRYISNNDFHGQYKRLFST